MKTFGRFLRYGLLGLGILSFLAAAPNLQADDDPPEEAVPEAVADDEQVNQPNLENVDESLFGKQRATAIPVIRLHLEEILKRKVNAARTRWHLSDGQVDKLEFVGSNSITKLFQQMDQHGKKLKAARQGINNRYDDNALNRETSELRSKVRSGPFENDSLFAKVLRQLLTAEQAADYDRRLANVANPPGISRQNAINLARVDRLKRNIYRFAWNRDGSQLALVESQKKVEIFAFPEIRLVRTLAEKNKPQDFKFGPDNHVAMAEVGTGAVIANLATGEEVRFDAENQPYCIEFAPDGKSLVTGSGYSTFVTLRSVPDGERVRTFTLDGVKGGMTPVFNPDGTLLAVGNRNSTTHIFEVATGRTLHVLPHRSSHQIRFSPKGDLLAVVYVDGMLILWDTKTGELKKQVRAFANELYTVDWSPDGTLLATAGYHTPVTLWNAEDLSIVNELESPEWIFEVRFSPDGTRLLTAGYGLVQAADKFVDIWAVP